ncbi:MAG: phosphotransferase, partial [Eubacteriales bacterium]
MSEGTMALEKSILSLESIRILLRMNYGMEADKIEKLPLGSANCYKVSASEGTLFLKEFQSDFPEEALCREAELVNFLKQRHFPTAAILPLRDGSLYFRHSGRLVYVQEFLEGRTYTNDLPKPLLMQAAELLGRLHSLLLGFELPREMDSGWLTSYSAEKTAAQYDNLLTILEDFRSDPNYERIREDLLWKRTFAAQNAALRSSYEGITYRASHGDYTAMQFLCGEEEIKAVVDFSRAAVLPAVWEIMRSYVQSCGACKNGTAFDTEEFCH